MIWAVLAFLGGPAMALRADGGETLEVATAAGGRKALFGPSARAVELV
jgi:hypothetical protein